MHVAQRLQQLSTLYGNFHGKTRFGAFKNNPETRRDRKPAVRGMRGRGRKVTNVGGLGKGAFLVPDHIPKASTTLICHGQAGHRKSGPAAHSIPTSGGASSGAA
jgi:hypothetical protein